MKWKAKAVVQKVISFLPQKQRINTLFQKYVTRGLALTDEHFRYKIEHARDHLQYQKRYGETRFSEAKILELGTGWYPIVPVSFYLCGATDVTSIDIQSWITRDTLRTTVEKFRTWYDRGELARYLPGLDERRWHELLATITSDAELTSLLSQLNIRIQVGDARMIEYPDGYFDFICSNNTFEHIHRPILEDILREFQRLLKHVRGGE